MSRMESDAPLTVTMGALATDRVAADSNDACRLYLEPQA
jgi:hypothetical protein